VAVAAVASAAWVGAGWTGTTGGAAVCGAAVAGVVAGEAVALPVELLEASDLSEPSLFFEAPADGAPGPPVAEVLPPALAPLDGGTAGGGADCGAAAGALPWGCAEAVALSRCCPKDAPLADAAAPAPAADGAGDGSDPTGGRDAMFMPGHAFRCQRSRSKLRASRGRSHQLIDYTDK
jgi:hypothetical protein